MRSRLILLRSLALGVALGFSGAQGAAKEALCPTPQRVAEIAAWLPATPAGVGAPATDRAAWADVATRLPVAGLMTAAEKAVTEPVPALSDELFLEFSRNGNRSHYQEPFRKRLDRLNLFAWAEALEHRGRFVPALERELAAIFGEKTWVYPAHDPKLDNFYGRVTGVDLGVATRGWVVATALHWHADQLAPATVARGRAELRRRVIEPYLAQMRADAALAASGEEIPPVQTLEGLWWRRVEHNWNAVCHAGVLGTALAVVEARSERAAIVAQAELNLPRYLAGFTADGYCGEGVGYWNYGFGHCAMLAETVAQATGGRVHLLQGERAARVVAYPRQLEILPGLYPAFADMNPKEQPSAWFLALAERQLAATPVGVRQPDLPVTDLRELLLYQSALEVFVGRATAGLSPVTVGAPAGDSHWFPDAQVYVGRATPRFGAALKGGNNGENHHHHDLGSFVVAVGQTELLVDPGAEVYTKRTFSADRFKSQVLNSYGHDVPLVAGQLQQEGRPHAARVVSTEFRPDADTVVLDLAGGYAVPELRRLVRSFTLRRGAHPTVIVEDRVEFSTPASFGTALITFDSWKELSPGVYEVSAGADQVRVEVAVTGASWTLQPEVLHEDLPGKRRPMRLGINLATPVKLATIRLTITPQ